jgi:hypothetical protein
MFNSDPKWFYREIKSQPLLDQLICTYWRRAGINMIKNGKTKEAIKIFSENAKIRNDPRSFTCLGYIFQFRNPKIAIELYKRGLKRGDNKSAVMLSIIYFHGIGKIKKDLRKSSWYRSVAPCESPLLIMKEEGF